MSAQSASMNQKRKESEAEKTARLRTLRLAQPQPKPIKVTAVIWKLADVLPFGKHHGRTVEYVIAEHRSWITYALENFTDFELDPQAQAEYEAADDPRRPPRAWE